MFIRYALGHLRASAGQGVKDVLCGRSFIVSLAVFHVRWFVLAFESLLILLIMRSYAQLCAAYGSLPHNFMASADALAEGMSPLCFSFCLHFTYLLELQVRGRIAILGHVNAGGQCLEIEQVCFDLMRNHPSTLPMAH